MVTRRNRDDVTKLTEEEVIGPGEPLSMRRLRGVTLNHDRVISTTVMNPPSFHGFRLFLFISILKNQL